MKTIKVQISVYYNELNTDGTLRYGNSLFDERQTLDITEEQMGYLREVEFGLSDYDAAEFAELRPDFQELAETLVHPFLDYLRQQYVDAGFDEKTIAEKMAQTDYSVSKVRDTDDDRYHWEEGRLWVQDGILYRHNHEKCNLGVITLVRCLDPRKEVVVSEIADRVAERAFFNCQYLKEVRLPKAETIGPLAFCGCTSLRKVELSEDLQIIEEDAFGDCHMLREFRLPRYIVSIRNSAFYQCTNLERLIFADGSCITDEYPQRQEIPSSLVIYEDAFAYTPLDFLSQNDCYTYNDEDYYYEC